MSENNEGFQITLETLFTEARTQNGFLPTEISEDTLKKLYDVFKYGPTAANSTPARVVFVKSAEAKDRLIPLLAPGNQQKSREAAVVAIVGYDLEFYEQLPKLFPPADARSWFVGNEALIQESAFRGSTLQGAYLIIAARALGLDAGPMGGFNADGINAEFFPDGKVKVNFVINLGNGDPAKVYPRLPRLEFDEACKII